MYWNITDKERLYQAFELANNRKLLENFLSDILTEKEMEQCIKRLKAACLIHDCASYTQIHLMTKLSPSTIARLSKRFNKQDCGFSQIIKKFLSKGNGRAYFE
ncbi:MAG: Trp family transcriptional regulator [bacterium]|nr:Trp family transcriptional regulator [bacterium]